MATIACEVIIPTVSGRTRLPWTPNKLPDWERAVAYLFGGISPIACGVIGRWRDPAAMPGRGVVPDPQNRYEVAVPGDRVGELRELMRFSCAHFEQECLYFKVGHTVEFLCNPLGWPWKGCRRCPVVLRRVFDKHKARTCPHACKASENAAQTRELDNPIATGWELRPRHRRTPWRLTNC